MLAHPDFELTKSNGLSAVKENSFNDEVLWNSFKKGNELALSLLYKKYVQLLFDYGMHICKDRDMALDCLQELFLRLWNKRETISSIHSVRPYLYKSFRRLLIHHLVEMRKVSARVTEAGAFEFSLSVESTLIEDELRAERLKKLRACILALTKGQREVIYLRFFNELTYHEIAEVTETQVDSVYNLVSKSIQSLRKKLQPSRPLVAVPQ